MIKALSTMTPTLEWTLSKDLLGGSQLVCMDLIQLTMCLLPHIISQRVLSLQTPWIMQLDQNQWLQWSQMSFPSKLELIQTCTRPLVLSTKLKLLRLSGEIVQQLQTIWWLDYQLPTHLPIWMKSSLIHQNLEPTSSAKLEMQLLHLTFWMQRHWLPKIQPHMSVSSTMRTFNTSMRHMQLMNSMLSSRDSDLWVMIRYNISTTILSNLSINLFSKTQPVMSQLPWVLSSTSR